MLERPWYIYLTNADGSDLRNLTNGKRFKEDQAWPPDGTRMAFVYGRSGNDEIYLLDVEAMLESGDGDPIRLTDTQQDGADPVWSPDGTCIVFLSLGDTSPGLFVVAADGSGLA